jgi:hypothetical protein
MRIHIFRTAYQTPYQTHFIIFHREQLALKGSLRLRQTLRIKTNVVALDHVGSAQKNKHMSMRNGKLNVI